MNAAADTLRAMLRRPMAYPNIEAWRAGVHELIEALDAALAAERLAAETRFFTLYAAAHRSDPAGQRAGLALMTWAEDWYDANIEGGWPLPRRIIG